MDKRKRIKSDLPDLNPIKPNSRNSISNKKSIDKNNPKIDKDTSDTIKNITLQIKQNANFATITSSDPPQSQSLNTKILKIYTDLIQKNITKEKNINFILHKLSLEITNTNNTKEIKEQIFYLISSFFSPFNNSTNSYNIEITFPYISRILTIFQKHILSFNPIIIEKNFTKIIKNLFIDNKAYAETFKEQEIYDIFQGFCIYNMKSDTQINPLIGVNCLYLLIDLLDYYLIYDKYCKYLWSNIYKYLTNDYFEYKNNLIKCLKRLSGKANINQNYTNLYSNTILKLISFIKKNSFDSKKECVEIVYNILSKFDEVLFDENVIMEIRNCFSYLMEYDDDMYIREISDKIIGLLGQNEGNFEENDMGNDGDIENEIDIGVKDWDNNKENNDKNEIDANNYISNNVNNKDLNLIKINNLSCKHKNNKYFNTSPNKKLNFTKKNYANTYKNNKLKPLVDNNSFLDNDNKNCNNNLDNINNINNINNILDINKFNQTSKNKNNNRINKINFAKSDNLINKKKSKTKIQFTPSKPIINTANSNKSNKAVYRRNLMSNNIINDNNSSSINNNGNANSKVNNMKKNTPVNNNKLVKNQKSKSITKLEIKSPVNSKIKMYKENALNILSSKEDNGTINNTNNNNNNNSKSRGNKSIFKTEKNKKFFENKYNKDVIYLDKSNSYNNNTNNNNNNKNIDNNDNNDNIIDDINNINKINNINISKSNQIYRKTSTKFSSNNLKDKAATLNSNSNNNTLTHNKETLKNSLKELTNFQTSEKELKNYIIPSTPNSYNNNTTNNNPHKNNNKTNQNNNIDIDLNINLVFKQMKELSEKQLNLIDELDKIQNKFKTSEDNLLNKINNLEFIIANKLIIETNNNNNQNNSTSNLNENTNRSSLNNIYNSNNLNELIEYKNIDGIYKFYNQVSISKIKSNYNAGDVEKSFEILADNLCVEINNVADGDEGFIGDLVGKFIFVCKKVIIGLKYKFSKGVYDKINELFNNIINENNDNDDNDDNNDDNNYDNNNDKNNVCKYIDRSKLFEIKLIENYIESINNNNLLNNE